MKDRPSIRSEHVTMPLTPEELLSRGKAKNGQSLSPSTSASEFPSSRLAHTLYSGGRSEKKIWKQEKNVSMRGGGAGGVNLGRCKAQISQLLYSRAGENHHHRAPPTDCAAG